MFVCARTTVGKRMTDDGTFRSPPPHPTSFDHLQPLQTLFVCILSLISAHYFPARLPCKVTCMYDLPRARSVAQEHPQPSLSNLASCCALHCEENNGAVRNALLKWTEICFSSQLEHGGSDVCSRHLVSLDILSRLQVNEDFMRFSSIHANPSSPHIDDDQV